MGGGRGKIVGSFDGYIVFAYERLPGRPDSSRPKVRLVSHVEDKEAGFGGGGGGVLIVIHARSLKTIDPRTRAVSRRSNGGRRGGVRGGVGGASFAACLRNFTIDHASLSRRRTVLQGQYF